MSENLNEKSLKVVRLREKLLDDLQKPDILLNVVQRVAPHIGYKIMYQHYFQMAQLGYFKTIGFIKEGRVVRKIYQSTTDKYIHNGMEVVDANPEVKNKIISKILPENKNCRIVKERHVPRVDKKRHKVHIGSTMGMV